MSTITSLNANDNGATSRGVINTNVTNLNTDKLENSSLTGATGKTTPVDADTMPINNSADSNALYKVTWANLKATLKTYFDTLYTAVNTAIPLSYLDTDGTMAANADDKVASQKAVRTYVAANGSTDWNTIATAPTTITNLGQRSYSLVYPSVDLTSTIHPGMRLRTTRTVAAPTQCTSLNGTTQYYSKTSPTGVSFTASWTQIAKIYLTSYPTVAAGIQGRRNGATEGWAMYINASGCLVVSGCRVAGNSKSAVSTQSVPLNRWVDVAVSMDMTAGATSGATWYIDEVSVPGVVTQTGTATAIVQGTTEMTVGSVESAGNYFFPGKIAQCAVFSGIVSQANIREYQSRPLLGTETNLISAYSFNNTINDLNTTNANNLTAVASAVATNADSPFGLNSYGTPTGTLDYALVQAVSYGAPDTTVTVQVPWGCTIPTSGGVTTSAYSSVKAPYGFPTSADRWAIYTKLGSIYTNAGTTINTVYNFNTINLAVPIGRWLLNNKMSYQITTTSTIQSFATGISSSSTAFTSGAPDWSQLNYQGGLTAGNLAVKTHCVYNSPMNNAAVVKIYPLLMSTVAFTTPGIRGVINTTAAEDSSIWAIPADL